MSIETSDELAADQHLRSALRERTPAEIECQVMSVSAMSTLDDLCAALDAAEWLLSRARTIDGLMKQIAIAWIDRNGEFEIGDQYYAVGYSTTVKCLDTSQTGHAVLEAGGGDVDRLLSVLIAQPYKHASVRNLLPQKQYGSLFKVIRNGRLVNGTPERVLKRGDKRFLPRASST